MDELIRTAGARPALIGVLRARRKVRSRDAPPMLREADAASRPA